MKYALAALAVLAAHPASAADPFGADADTVRAGRPIAAYSTLRGKAAALDGKTLWFAAVGRSVRLADIDTCDVPQWALNPRWENRSAAKAPPPVACGALAKAWLKRNVDGRSITCQVYSVPPSGHYVGRCSNGRTDLGREMLRVGWARVATPYAADPTYKELQRYAVTARYGMWDTYVLDMKEWRRKAVDKTHARQPIADFNLLRERESEISPPFADIRRKPHRTDR